MELKDDIMNRVARANINLDKDKTVTSEYKFRASELFVKNEMLSVLIDIRDILYKIKR